MEKLITGLQITLIGMGIVFIILYLISLALNLMQPIFYKPQKEQKPTQTQPEPKEKDQPGQDQSELIAVITAAIVAAAGTTKQIKVTSIKRIPTTTPIWGQAARHENTR